MKRGGLLKRKTPLRTSGKPYNTLGRHSSLKSSTLAKISKSPIAATKRRIQSLLREIVSRRDGGCVLLRYPIAGLCGGVLQGEHLITRSRSATFGDTRNIVCLCQKHHIFWKPQNSRLYWELIEEILGPARWSWLKLAEANNAPFKADWVAVEMALIHELANLTHE